MADVIDTSEFRNGLKILIDNEPFVIVEFQHVKPGKGSAFVRTRYKSLISGRTLEKNFKSGEKVGRPDIEEKKMQYLYKEGDHYVFMDSKNYEQSHIDAAGLGDSKVTAGFNKIQSPKATAAFHLSVETLAGLVNGQPRRPEGLPVTSFALSVADTGLQLDLHLPIADIKVIARASSRGHP